MATAVIDTLMGRFAEAGEAPALAYQGELKSFSWVVQEVEDATRWLIEAGVGQGQTVILNADYAPKTVAILLALTRLRAIIVPLLPATRKTLVRVLPLVEAEHEIVVDPSGSIAMHALPASEKNAPLIADVRARKAAGLILFTSGSTGEPKGVVHDFSLLLEKFLTRRPALVTLNFLMFDHWGGLNTLLHGLSNLSLVVLPENRRPDYVCGLIEAHGVELLPATPTFLNMLLLSKAWLNRDFSTLRIISYGAEPMPESTLRQLGAAFPTVELRQTYGLIELGVLRAKSRDDGSLWVRLGGAGFDIRVVDDELQIRSPSAMLGYLNAPSPFTEDGYFMTGDKVEVDGDYFRILGRASDLINIGGDKVYPAEVESVLLTLDNIKDAAVYGESHPLMGKIVCADIVLLNPEPAAEARVRIKKSCQDKIDRFKIPVKINFPEESLASDRLKKRRLKPPPA
ncbi:MAG: long-chain fatty acid--CoA ligase [Rhodospirillales bacterium]